MRPIRYLLACIAQLYFGIITIIKELDKSLRKESKMVQTKKQHCAFR